MSTGLDSFFRLVDTRSERTTRSPEARLFWQLAKLKLYELRDRELSPRAMVINFHCYLTQVTAACMARSRVKVVETDFHWASLVLNKLFLARGAEGAAEADGSSHVSMPLQEQVARLVQVHVPVPLRVRITQLVQSLMERLPDNFAAKERAALVNRLEGTSYKYFLSGDDFLLDERGEMQSIQFGFASHEARDLEAAIKNRFLGKREISSQAELTEHGELCISDINQLTKDWRLLAPRFGIFLGAAEDRAEVIEQYLTAIRDKIDDDLVWLIPGLLSQSEDCPWLRTLREFEGLWVKSTDAFIVEDIDERSAENFNLTIDEDQQGFHFVVRKRVKTMQPVGALNSD